MTSPKADEFAEIRERLAKATPGPWYLGYDDNGFYYVRAEGMPSPYIVATGGEGGIDEANALLAAHAPTDISRLLSALDSANARIKELERTVEEMKL